MRISLRHLTPVFFLDSITCTKVIFRTTCNKTSSLLNQSIFWVSSFYFSLVEYNERVTSPINIDYHFCINGNYYTVELLVLGIFSMHYLPGRVRFTFWHLRCPPPKKWTMMGLIIICDGHGSVSILAYHPHHHIKMNLCLVGYLISPYLSVISTKQHFPHSGRWSYITSKNIIIAGLLSLCLIRDLQFCLTSRNDGDDKVFSKLYLPHLLFLARTRTQRKDLVCLVDLVSHHLCCTSRLKSPWMITTIILYNGKYSRKTLWVNNRIIKTFKN